MAAPEEVPAPPVSVRRSLPAPGPTVVVIGAPIVSAGIPALCERMGALLEKSTADVVCDVGALLDPDAAAVDAVARVALTARRAGRDIRWLHASNRLGELLTLTGLHEAVGLGRGLPLEPRGQTEQWEHAGGVEEEGDPGDPAP